MRYFNLLGVAACLLLVIVCFLPWTYYPDLDKTFTGFFSQGNLYGKPGIGFITLSILAIFMFIIPRTWAKRVNMGIGALILAYGIKTFILFTSCYGGDCPLKKAGIFLILFLPLLILVMTLLPELRLREDKE
jgi:hypothetical protein